MEGDKKIPHFYRDQHLKYTLSLENSKDLHSIGKYLT